MANQKMHFPEPVRWSVRELKEASIYLYGGHWRKALAADMGYSLAAVNSWADEKHPVPIVVSQHLRLKVGMMALLTQTPTSPYSSS